VSRERSTACSVRITQRGGREGPLRADCDRGATIRTSEVSIPTFAAPLKKHRQIDTSDSNVVPTRCKKTQMTS
jgi:hypothetical protein